MLCRKDRTLPQLTNTFNRFEQKLTLERFNNFFLPLVISFNYTIPVEQVLAFAPIIFSRTFLVFRGSRRTCFVNCAVTN